jgi:phage-related protein
MEILDYITEGGKNLIKEFLSSLPVHERTYGYGIRHKIISDGLKAFDGFDTRQLFEKLWEIKFYDNRIMYVILDKNTVHFLHACKKQKGKAEKFELDKAIRRAKERNLL